MVHDDKCHKVKIKQWVIEDAEVGRGCYFLYLVFRIILILQMRKLKLRKIKLHLRIHDLQMAGLGCVPMASGLHIGLSHLSPTLAFPYCIMFPFAKSFSQAAIYCTSSAHLESALCLPSYVSPSLTVTGGNKQVSSSQWGWQGWEPLKSCHEWI